MHNFECSLLKFIWKKCWNARDALSDCFVHISLNPTFDFVAQVIHLPQRNNQQCTKIQHLFSRKKHFGGMLEVLWTRYYRLGSVVLFGMFLSWHGPPLPFPFLSVILLVPSKNCDWIDSRMHWQTHGKGNTACVVMQKGGEGGTGKRKTEAGMREGSQSGGGRELFSGWRGKRSGQKKRKKEDEGPGEISGVSIKKGGDGGVIGWEGKFASSA